jgi:hypothetical protein
MGIGRPATLFYKAGDKVGGLTVVDPDRRMLRRDGRADRAVLVRCACGTEFETLIGNLRGRVKSCGCLRRRAGPDSHTWSGVGIVPGRIVGNIISGCRRRGKQLEVTITTAYLWELFQRQGGRCALSGVPLHFNVGSQRNTSITASVDRIDPDRGYVPGNVQWVHKAVNMMKGELDETEFLMWCSRVARARRARGDEPGSSLPLPLPLDDSR